jgi:hypothetical protein
MSACSKSLETRGASVLANIPALEAELSAGSIVVLGESTARVRRLPIR